uniref:2'-phosphotransferase n=2 Tax=Sus scrofa TaxID=9823 RepID=A0A8D1BK53_PIG
MGRSLRVFTCYCSSQDLAMNSGGRRQEAAESRGRRAHRPREQDRDVQLSKALSYALRHGALKLGLPMGADGFVPLGALLQLPQFRSFSAEDVQRVVDTNEKQRFTLQPGDPSTGPLIRANQGHSLQVPALELIPLETPQALPLMLVHGTFWRHWPSILLKGLSRQGRTHIHLAPGLPGDPGVISGMRPNCEVAVFINGPQALADGIPFFRSANGVILTPGNTDGVLLPKYFKEALQLRPTRKNHHPTPVLFFFFFFFFFVFLLFLGPLSWHMEVPRLGVESELEPPAYARATATRDPSRICNLHHSSRQCQIVNPLSKARDRTRNLMVPSRIR